MKENYIIRNRNAKAFVKVFFSGNEINFQNEESASIETIIIDEEIYAALFCDEVRNVTFVIDAGDSQSVTTVLFHGDEEYNEFKRFLQSDLNLELSKQNIRINRYAESIAEKLANGVKLHVTDAADNSDMVECPECGMMNTKGSPYCMDCGADL